MYSGAIIRVICPFTPSFRGGGDWQRGSVIICKFFVKIEYFYRRVKSFNHPIDTRSKESASTMRATYVPFVVRYRYSLLKRLNRCQVRCLTSSRLTPQVKKKSLRACEHPSRRATWGLCLSFYFEAHYLIIHHEWATPW